MQSSSRTASSARRARTRARRACDSDDLVALLDEQRGRDGESTPPLIPTTIRSAMPQSVDALESVSRAEQLGQPVELFPSRR